MAFELEPLHFEYDALEPHIDADIIRFHYGKHTKKYFEVANDLAKGTIYEGKTLDQIINADSMIRMDSTLFNNASQAWNHAFYWKCLSPANKTGDPSAELVNAIEDRFDSFEQFRETFSDKANKHFGSGWVWLIVKDGNVQLRTTPNALSPLTEKNATPLLVCDVWEHAHYLQYPADRAGYVKAFWNVINWDFVNANYKNATT